jgi:hypothetical protein
MKELDPNNGKDGAKDGKASGEVVHLHMDLDDSREVKKVAEALLQREERLNIIGVCLLSLVLSCSATGCGTYCHDCD